jgi:hypothetical protein
MADGVARGPAPSNGGGGEPGEAERGDGGVAEGCGDLRGCTDTRLLGAFFHGDVAGVVQGVG